MREKERGNGRRGTEAEVQGRGGWGSRGERADVRGEDRRRSPRSRRSSRRHRTTTNVTVHAREPLG